MSDVEVRGQVTRGGQALGVKLDAGMGNTVRHRAQDTAAKPSQEGLEWLGTLWFSFGRQ